MKFLYSFLIFILLQLTGLTVGLTIPTVDQMGLRRWQKTIFNYDITKSVCHSVLTYCRRDSDCCPGLACVAAEDDFLCTPRG